jgi:DNA-binding transcriptional regulator YdaS (Cro superfamily)
MDKLLAYLNSLSKDEQTAFAERCGTSVGYLRKAASKGQLLGSALCVAIEQSTAGVVTRKDLRPDDWAQIWPELIDAA